MPHRAVLRSAALGCLAVSAGLGLGCRSAMRVTAPREMQPAAPITASEALMRLKEGNRRFVEGRARHAHTSRAWRESLVADQRPSAVIVGCADSRVPPELVFDQGLGDLFVIRNAGNVIAVDVLASIEYAIDHLHSPLVVIMGHDKCGAVTAALRPRSEREDEGVELQIVLRMIEPALANIAEAGSTEERVAAGVEANVRSGVAYLDRLRDERKRPLAMKVKFVGAVYCLRTGNVRFLE